MIDIPSVEYLQILISPSGTLWVNVITKQDDQTTESYCALRAQRVKTLAICDERTKETIHQQTVQV